MKYKKGDWIKIKSRKWYEQEKNEYGKIPAKILKLIVSFNVNMANECCGEIYQIKTIDSDGTYGIYSNTRTRWWLVDAWIEKKIERINIHLKLMKNEI